MEDLEMKTLIRIMIVVIVSCLPAAAAGTDLRDLLQPHSISGVRVNLNPWGPHLGFEMELAGDAPHVEALVAVIRAKGGKRESDFVLAFDRHRPLRRALRRLIGA